MSARQSRHNSYLADEWRSAARQASETYLWRPQILGKHTPSYPQGGVIYIGAAALGSHTQRCSLEPSSISTIREFRVYFQCKRMCNGWCERTWAVVRSSRLAGQDVLEQSLPNNKKDSGRSPIRIGRRSWSLHDRSAARVRRGGLIMAAGDRRASVPLPAPRFLCWRRRFSLAPPLPGSPAFVARPVDPSLPFPPPRHEPMAHPCVSLVPRRAPDRHFSIRRGSARPLLETTGVTDGHHVGRD